ncbi:hypothetical protein ACHAXT_001937 [Thalassiosira profunda]
MSAGSAVVGGPPAASDEAPAPAANGGEERSNRLAPYNPTHDTAQTAALDLLMLTSRDVFFDLGCGDGRLIVAALERCYDDEYLMRVHRRRFAKLRLQEDAEEERPGGQREGQPRAHIRKSSTPSSAHRKISHNRSMSTDYSVPHLMRTSSDVSEDPSAVTPLKTNSGSNKSSAHQEGNADGDEHESADGLSALSPTSFHPPTTAPTSPETPVACNKRLGKLHVNIPEPFPSALPPILPNTAEDEPAVKEFQRLDSKRTPVEAPTEEGIPTCIETPSPDGKKTFHAPQISELPTDPTDYASLAEQLLATVPSGDEFAEVDAAAVLGEQGEEALGGGLRCVGIEYNQALADSAQENVRKSYVYSHVEEKVCVRWGDVLDEWTRGRSAGVEAEAEGLAQSGEMTNASELTLLDDATAVFVYLLPQGLKKVKPLLYEAAVKRRRQQERRRWQIQQQQERKQMEEVKELQEQLQQPAQLGHPLHPLHQPAPEEVDGLFSPNVPRQLVHKKGASHVSHVSDITDCDFLRSRESLDMPKTLEEEGVGFGVLPEIPPFRVASYMFSVPGWTPTKVDRSGKGQCPVYLYENILEQGREDDR